MADNEILQMHDLKPAPGAKKDRTRVGRGEGSKGKTAGRGAKGQTKRNHVRPGFEGGQLPLQRRVPKRGFNNIFATEYAILNVAALNAFEDGAVVDLEAVKKAGLVKKGCDGLKVLGNGALQKNITVKAAAFSEAAKAKIEAAGGKAEVI